MRSIVLYAYYEKNENYKLNLEYFLEHGINDESDFLFIINGECSVEIPAGNNIRIMKRSNEGYDFGAWTDGVKFINKNNYDYFIFINTSVRGPFLKNKEKPWQYYFTDLIKDDTKLVGTTINISTLKFPLLQKWKPPYAHVQSQMFAMDRECLDYLQDKVFIPHNPDHSFEDIIQLKEVGMSQWVLRNDWNINCILEKYKDLEYRNIKSDINHSSLNGDPSFEGCYFGKTYTPYDVIFIKTNRDLHIMEGLINKRINDINKLIPIGILLFGCLAYFAMNQK